MDFDFKLDKNILEKIKKMNFPRSLNEKEWERYLNRKLNPEESFYFEEYRMEKRFNDYILKLHNIATKKGLYIPYLTGLYGNCLFESLMLHNLFEDDEKFRKNLAILMYIFKDKKNLFPNQECSLSELFSFTNEIEFVMSKNHKKLFKYDYSAMCQDLSNEFSWSRLPTQLIMMAISYFFNVKFHIISNKNEYEHEIYMGTEENPLDIYLGHIEELHYVPLEVRKGSPSEDVIPKHTTAKTNFFKWAIVMWNSINNDNSLLTREEKDVITVDKFTDISQNILDNNEKNMVDYE